MASPDEEFLALLEANAPVRTGLTGRVPIQGSAAPRASVSGRVPGGGAVQASTPVAGGLTGRVTPTATDENAILAALAAVENPSAGWEVKRQAQELLRSVDPTALAAAKAKGGATGAAGDPFTAGSWGSALADAGDAYLAPFQGITEGIKGAYEVAKDPVGAGGRFLGAPVGEGLAAVRNKQQPSVAKAGAVGGVPQPPPQPAPSIMGPSMEDLTAPLGGTPEDEYQSKLAMARTPPSKRPAGPGMSPTFTNDDLIAARVGRGEGMGGTVSDLTIDGPGGEHQRLLAKRRELEENQLDQQLQMSLFTPQEMARASGAIKPASADQAYFATGMEALGSPQQSIEIALVLAERTAGRPLTEEEQLRTIQAARKDWLEMFQRINPRASSLGY